MTTIELRVPALPPPLINAFRGDSRRVIVLVGSGLSRSVERENGLRFPSWVQLIQEMLGHAKSQGFAFTAAQEGALAKLLGAGTSQGYLLAAGWLQRRLGAPFFLQFLSDSMAAPPGLTSPVHDHLHRLPARGIITFNYDPLIEKTWPGDGPSFVATNADGSMLAQIMRGSAERFLLKCHGTYERPETIVLGHDDYRRLIHENKAYRDTLATLFSQSTILALGCGVDDPDLDFLFNDLLTTFPAMPLGIYALVPENRYDEITRELWLAERGVRLLEYAPSDDSHPEVAYFLQTLVERIGMPEAPSRRPAVSSLARDRAEGRRRRAAFELKVTELFASPGIHYARYRCQCVDRIVEESFAAAAAESPGAFDHAVMVAQGGYGLGRLSYDSDADLTLVFSKEHESAALAGLAAFNRIMLDGTAPANGHCGAQDIEGCEALWDQHARSLLAYSFSRAIGGNGAYHGDLRARWRDYVRRADITRLAERVEALLPQELIDDALPAEWNTKTGSGGLREATGVLFWRQVAVARQVVIPDPDPGPLDDAIEVVMRLREALCLEFDHHNYRSGALPALSQRLGMAGSVLAADVMRARNTIRRAHTRTLSALLVRS
jgi:hypothetical protein